jgi:antirestriction protein
MKNLSDRVFEGADVIDSRDVIERIEELKGERADIERGGEPGQDMTATLAEWDASEDGEELTRLNMLAAECEGYSDWKYGEALIADHYFKEYAQELAEDIGAVQRDAMWPNQYIDWDAAADALKQDYSSVEYGSTTYWIRS